MAAFVRNSALCARIGDRTIDFTADVFKLGLSLVLPNAAIYANLTEIANGNGYLTGGKTFPNQTTVGGVDEFDLVGDQVVWTAAGGSIADFRYVFLYDSSTPNKDVLGYWDTGAVNTITDTKTFTVKPSRIAMAGAIIKIL